eukprot:scpid79664/ scgid5709/ Mitotic apparatus protein p62
MSESLFWTVELTKGNPESTWPASTPDDEAAEAATYVLEVERACLGSSAKQNDLNIVSVSTVAQDGETNNVTPIARLKVGGKEQCRIGLQFSSNVTFKLTSGNGPVHLMGLHETEYDDENDIDDMEAYDDSEEEDDSEEDSEEGDALAAMPRVAAKKRPATSGAPPAKKQARGISMPMDDEDDSEDDDDSDDDELSLMAKKGLLAAVGDDDDDSDEDDDDYDEDDDDEDDDEDDDDDDEEEEDDDDEDMEVPQLVPAKGKAAAPQQQKNGKPQQGKAQQGKPQQGKAQQGKPQQGKAQQGKAQQGKPQQEAKPQTPQKGKEQPSIDAIRQKLTTSPNLPKKPEKFNNYIKNTYKVTDQKVISDLWQHVQKSRK